MQAVRFLQDAPAGRQRYYAGEVAGVPDVEVDRLVAAGAAEVVAPVADSAEAEQPAAVQARRRKPGRPRRKPGRPRTRKG